jgi:hypothetical protein
MKTSSARLAVSSPADQLTRAVQSVQQPSAAPRLGLARIFLKKELKRNLNLKKGAGLGNFEKWVPPAQ